MNYPILSVVDFFNGCALDAAGEGALVALSVPLFDPCIGAHRSVDALEILAHLCTLTLDLLATVKVNVALVAVTSLICVGEARIEWSCLQLNLCFNCFRCHLGNCFRLRFLKSLKVNQSIFVSVVIDVAYYGGEKTYVSYTNDTKKA